MWVFGEQEIQEAISLDMEVVKAIEKGFFTLVEKRVQVPPILRVDLSEYQGEVDVKTAVVKGEPYFAVKISSGFFNNPHRGLPSGSGMMILLNVETGFPEAIFLDHGYLTDIRTAAAGAVAAKYLALETIQTAGMIGAGTQARYQMKALALVRSLDQIRIWSRSRERAEDCAKEMKTELGVRVEVFPHPEPVVRGSDVVVTATPSTTPLVQKEWFHDGLHLTAMGSDSEYKQEVEVDAIASADRLICDDREQSFRLGELRSAWDEGRLRNKEVTELGDIVAGRAPGRRSNKEVTLCDLTGVGVQDTVIAIMAYHRLKQQKKGVRL
ncbi:cyclodeaminase [Melghirimyces algeriensis]|uniref:Ornithine cyclodeaminase n=1 Tax=Melghirimyces algeriensis TaxID=910412 RepID=A0A521CV76_9BACL|nr:cyclodeaminase [Melghirimyces algeriensis]SMO63357.1 ornithine cyclodeaminase [Melghirimyces algeriensis]